MQWLWHGTRGVDPLTIAHSGVGLDPRRSATTGLYFGNGVYFATNALYSMHYAHYVPTAAADEAAHPANATSATGDSDAAAPTGSKRRWHVVTGQLLLCAVALGRGLDHGNGTAPHLRLAPDGYDSVSGTTEQLAGTAMHVVYSPTQCVAAYVVTVQVVVPCMHSVVASGNRDANLKCSFCAGSAAGTTVTGSDGGGGVGVTRDSDSTAAEATRTPGRSTTGGLQVARFSTIPDAVSCQCGTPAPPGPASQTGSDASNGVRRVPADSGVTFGSMSASSSAVPVLTGTAPSPGSPSTPSRCFRLRTRKEVMMPVS